MMNWWLNNRGEEALSSIFLIYWAGAPAAVLASADKAVALFFFFFLNPFLFSVFLALAHFVYLVYCSVCLSKHIPVYWQKLVIRRKVVRPGKVETLSKIIKSESCFPF